MVVLWLETTKKGNKKVSMKLIASLAPDRAEVEAGAVAKADQQLCCQVSVYTVCDSLGKYFCI